MPGISPFDRELRRAFSFVRVEWDIGHFAGSIGQSTQDIGQVA